MELHETPQRFHLTRRDRRVALGFVIAACAAGTLTFLAGSGLRELLFAPRYRPVPPAPAGSPPNREAIRWGAPEPQSTHPNSWNSPAPGHARPARQAGLPEARDVILTEDLGNWIRIPALSLNYPLATARSMESADILRALHIGLVRYPNGVEPGAAGVVAIAGHSTGEPWKGRYRFAFLHARKLQPGDLIHVDNAGTRYTYRATGHRMVNPAKSPFLSSVADRPKLALLTCWPLWTTQRRLVVDAELLETALLTLRKVSASAHEMPIHSEQGA